MAYSRRFPIAAAIACILALGVPRFGWAAEPIGWGGVLSHPSSVQLSPFIEGINPNVAVDDSRVYAAFWFALPYTPSVSYSIDRVEFIHGEGTGTVDIQVRTDNSGAPSNTILTQGSHQLQLPVGFQGADMPPAMLTAGTKYWVVVQVVNSTQGSVGLHGQGTEIAYFYGPDGTTWNGGAPTEVWIARFYGTVSTPATRSTWGELKARYRNVEYLGQP